MRERSNYNVSPLGVWRWNSPTPYLFGGLLLIIGLIATALLILACSYRKRRSLSLSSSSSPTPDDDDDADHIGWQLSGIRADVVHVEVDTKPKIVVVMAGDEQPTYYAEPL